LPSACLPPLCPPCSSLHLDICPLSPLQGSRYCLTSSLKQDLCLCPAFPQEQPAPSLPLPLGLGPCFCLLSSCKRLGSSKETPHSLSLLPGSKETLYSLSLASWGAWPIWTAVVACGHRVPAAEDSGQGTWVESHTLPSDRLLHPRSRLCPHPANPTPAAPALYT
jgi:hypothetical protein